MLYLHKEREEFKNAVALASLRYHIVPEVAEKDYYVQMILRELSGRLPFIVFKGGTSLSKCHRVIKRFSEDIDISVNQAISQGQMRMVKRTVLEISQALGLSISNLSEIKSRRNYNQYILQYDSVIDSQDAAVQSSVLLEISYAEVSYPVILLPVHSYIGDLMAREAPNAQEEYLLKPFEMKVQNMDRTLIDKVFAICDYYLNGKVAGHSRHIYDIYKILPLIHQTEEFRLLIRQVRSERAKNSSCLSARQEVNIPELLSCIALNAVYEDDYNRITVRILEEKVTYNEAIEAIKKIALSNMFV